MKNILFRVDASNILGSGHVYRCLELSRIIQNKKKYKIQFLTSDLPGNLNNFIKKKKIKLKINKLNIKLKRSNFDNKKKISNFESLDIKKTKKFLHLNKKNILILDNKYLSTKWEKAIKPLIDHMIVINNHKKKRKYYCNTLYDPNLLSVNKKQIKDVNFLNSKNFFIYSGKYTKNIKRPEKKFNNSLKVLINFGNVDSKNLTFRVLKILQKINLAIKIKVVVISGKLNKNYKKIKNLCQKKENYIFFRHVENYKNILRHIKLSVGSSGHSFIEKLIMGVPTLIITSNEVQKNFANNIKKEKHGIYMGHYNTITDKKIKSEIVNAFNNEKKYLRLKKSIGKFISSAGDNEKNWQTYVGNI